MKRILPSLIALAACVFSAQAQYLTNGNLAVVRVGGEGELVSSNGLPVHIDQYTTAGALVNSVDLPSSGSNAFVLDNSTAEGTLTVSGNSQYLVLGGYNTPAGSGVGTHFGLNGTASSAVSRAIATVDDYGNYVLQITNNLAFTTWPISSAVYDGTNNFWMEGESSTNQYYGIVYVGSPSAPTTVEVYNTGDEEGVMNLYNGSLFLDTSFSPNGIYQVLNTNTPVAPLPESTNSATAVVSLASSSRNKDFVFDPGMTTCYYADTTAGIVKYTNDAGTWDLAYSIPATNAGGFTTKGALDITADWTQSPVVVYATTTESTGNRLIALVDSGPDAVPTMLAQAPTNHVDTTNVFRGVRFTPSNFAPSITNQPGGVVVNANGSATFSVGAIGTPALSYQWRTNGGAVSGATDSSITLDNVRTFESGTLLSVVITNAYGMTTSSNAALTVNPSFFVAGNLAVVRVGGAGQFVTSNGLPVHVDQFTTGGSLVSTVDLPSSGSNAFVLDNSTAEGYMTLSKGNAFLVLAGYNTPAGSGFGTDFGLNGTESSAVSRAIATVDGFGNYTLEITNNLAYSTWPISSAVFDGGTNYWMLGESSDNQYEGLIYAGTPSKPKTVVISSTGNEEAVLNLYNNSLFIDSSFTPNGIFEVLNTNTPAEALPESTNDAEPVISLAGTSRNKDFVFDSGMTTCYYADSTAGIVKYTNDAGTWSPAYTIPATNAGGFTTKGALGITADWTQSPVVVYATTAESSGNRLIALVDSGPTAVATMLAQAPTNHLDTTNVFRGLRFVPGEAPGILIPPSNVTQDAGGNATFTIVATGTPPLAYIWYTNSIPVAGATDSSLTLSNLNLGENHSTIFVIVTNSFGYSPFAEAMLTVQPPSSPVDVTINPPTTLTANAGGTAAFTASSVGSDVTYLWSLNGTPLTNGGSVTISGDTLTISPAYAAYDGTYTVVASNSFGPTPGNNSATLTVIDPIIVTEPAGSTNLPNGSVNLYVNAIGTPTLTYQWLSNNIAIPSATSSNLTVVNTGAIVSALYSVIVSNGLGNAITSAATTVSFTPVLLYDAFSYPNGNLFGDLGSPWIDINGNNPEIVTNGRVQISESNSTTDAQSLFSQPVSGTVLWASFIINLSTLPSNPGGVYFANIEDTNFNFFGRIFTLTSNNPTYTPKIPNVAFPGTYRLGIANAQNDSSSTATTGPSAVVPLDLAPGIDYQVVYYLDLNGQVSGMAINPAAMSDVTAAVGGVSSGPALDSFAPTNAMAAFGLRQRTDSTPKGEGEGVMEMDNLVVSFDWEGPGTGSGYPVVTQYITPSTPVIGLQPVGGTNFTGTSFTMEVAASGIGAAGSGLTYAWYQDGTNMVDGFSVSGSATPALTLNPLMATNGGTYYCVVTGAVGGPVQSSNAVLVVNAEPTPPVFTIEPAPFTTNSVGGTVTFDSLATGTGPITYAWFVSNTLGVTEVGTNADLTLTGLTTNYAGTYYVIATGDNGMFQTYSSNAVLVVTGPKSVTIAYLRSLLNPETYQPSDESTFYNITGVITTATNLTTGDTASYYIQDATGGINLFVTEGQDFRPALGDIVTATGTLSTYADNYELDVNEGGTGYTNAIVGSNAPMPTPILLPWGNDTAPLSPFLSTNVEGAVVIITNVYFEDYTEGAIFTNNPGIYTITNNTGESYTVFLSDQDTNLINGKLIPPFALSIAGPLVQDDLGIGITFTVWTNLVLPVPTVAITNPAPGATFAAPATVSIGAAASVLGNVVTNVQFFVNSNLAGASTTVPYNVTATNLAAGSYALTAVATAWGISATSAPVDITVTGTPPTTITNLTAGVGSANGTNSLLLQWSAIPSNSYSIWGTTNLLQPFTNLVSGLVFTNTTGSYTNFGLTNTAEFYEISSP